MALKNYQYDKLLREYDTRRMQAKYELDRRTDEVYKKIPKIKEIDEQIVVGSVNRARLALRGNDSALTDLDETNRRLSHEKAELLVANGFTPDYLELWYDCPDCHDTGFIGSEKCHCFRQALSSLIYDESNMRGLIEKENFGSFRFDLYDSSESARDPLLGLTPFENISRVVKIARDFVNNFNNEYRNLLIMGSTGVGKTFLSNCIAKELLDGAVSVLYLTAFQFYGVLEKNKFKSGEYIENTPYQVEYIFDCDLLILDDLGTELINSFTVSQLYACINERHLRKKSTVISTNLTIDHLEAAYGERIVSRLIQNYSLLKLTGDDIRLKL